MAVPEPVRAIHLRPLFAFLEIPTGRGQRSLYANKRQGGIAATSCGYIRPFSLARPFSQVPVSDIGERRDRAFGISPNGAGLPSPAWSIGGASHGDTGGVTCGPVKRPHLGAAYPQARGHISARISPGIIYTSKCIDIGWRGCAGCPGRSAGACSGVPVWCVRSCSRSGLSDVYLFTAGPGCVFVGAGVDVCARFIQFLRCRMRGLADGFIGIGAFSGL